MFFAIIGSPIGEGEIVTGKAPNGRSERSQFLWSLVAAMLPAVLFGGLLWSIGGYLAAALAALGVIFVALWTIYLYV